MFKPSAKGYFSGAGGMEIGLMTVPLRALLLGRYGIGHELNPQYFLDGAAHLKAAEYKINIPTLFDLINDVA